MFTFFNTVDPHDPRTWDCAGPAAIDLELTTDLARQTCVLENHRMSVEGVGHSRCISILVDCSIINTAAVGLHADHTVRPHQYLDQVTPLYWVAVQNPLPRPAEQLNSGPGVDKVWPASVILRLV